MNQNFTSVIIASILPLGAFAQSIVSTTPENKKVILEEFTGIHCGYCPEGHKLSEAIKKDNPDNVFLINIHEGSFASPSTGEPDFRTQFGTAIAGQTALDGYPSGTVNRHVFPGLEMTSSGTTALDRGAWKPAADIILAQPSYINVGVKASVDSNTRVMTINVEAYYTGNSPVSSNFLNIALLQDNTKGPQSSGGMGNNYNHMHRLIDMLTGQWGEEITTTSAGTLVQRTYTYTIPANHNSIPIVLGDLQLIAFVTESHQEVISGNGYYPAYTGLAHNNELAISSIDPIDPQCSGMVAPTIEIKNNGNNVLTSLDINYSINDGAMQTYTWTGELGGLQSKKINLPELAYTSDNNQIKFTIPSDEDNSNNEASVTFAKAVETTSSATLIVKTDQYAEECSWDIINAAGEIVYSGGPYNGQNNQIIEIPLTLPIDCYSLRIYDQYGDGGGQIRLKDKDGNFVITIPGNYGSGVVVNFSTNGAMGVSDANLSAVSIYPNPSNGQFNIDLKKSSSVEIFDMTGKLIYQTNLAEGKNSLNLNGKAKGVYILKLSDGKSVTTEKLVIK